MGGVAAIIGAGAAIVGAGTAIYSAEETRRTNIDLKKEAEQEQYRQDILVAEGARETAKTEEIAQAQETRNASKTAARKTRSAGGGGLLTGGDTGLMNTKKTKLGQ